MICEIEFEEGERVFSSCPDEIYPKLGDYAIFITDDGEEIGTIVKLLKSGEFSTKILRLATQQDLEKCQKNKEEELRAYKLCKEKAKELEIPIKVVATHIQFDKSILRVDFLAEKRVGLKRLMRELSKIHKERIEFRQIGSRTYTKRFNAFGVCGRQVCCAAFLKEFEPITVDFIKLQKLSCGTSKLTGVCGRLMCCLAYEKQFYEQKTEIRKQ